MKLIYFLIPWLLFPSQVLAAPLISVSPEQVLQGDPIMVTIEGARPLQITFDDKIIPIFTYEGTYRSLMGVDLSKQVGNYALQIILPEETITRIINISARPRPEVSVSIPQSLGGNTPQGQKQLISSLTRENAILNNVYTGKKAFWTKPFIFPVINPIVTNAYGYSEKSGTYSLPHKGTDFKAAIGTKVMAMNRGVIRIARFFRAYGGTIVVDHGLGVQTIYLHLSKIRVNVGELVLPGQTIGLSGDTGYSEGSHLHVSIKLYGTSIDPINFLSLFQKI